MEYIYSQHVSTPRSVCRQSWSMFLLPLLLLVLCFSLWLWVRWRRVKSYWLQKNVPHSKPHFIMGSLTFLQKKNPGIFMKDVYKNSKSPYHGIWLFWRPALIINSPDIARRVLVKDSDNFRNRFLSSGKSDPPGYLNLFTVNDPLWSSLRRRLSVLFTAAKLRALQNLNLKKSKDLVVRINREMENGEISNLRVLLTDYTTDVFGEAAFGILSEATLTGDSAIRKVTRELMEFSFIRGISWSSIFFIPELVDWLGLKFVPKQTSDFLNNILNKIIEQRTNSFAEIKETKDLVDALLNIKKEASLDGEEITDEVLFAQALIFLIGGFDTSGSVLTWATLELVHQQQLQDKLYNELFDAKQRLKDKILDPTTLAELPYLNAVIKEALRKFPPMGWLDRVAANDYVIDDKLTISKGRPIYVNAIGMHWDPEFFPEPEIFNPERFLPENEVNIKPYTYLPFGDGPRNCIGMRFGLQTVRYAIASIFSNFHVIPMPKTPKADNLDVEKKGLLFMPGEEISAKFIPRIK